MGSYVEKGRIFPGETMSRKQCEDEIERLCGKIRQVYRQYNPEGWYLSVCIIGHDLEVHNQYWKADKAYPLDMRKRHV